MESNADSLEVTYNESNRKTQTQPLLSNLTNFVISFNAILFETELQSSLV